MTERHRARFSRQRYQQFVESYQRNQLEETPYAAPGTAGQREARREQLRRYLKWLGPYRWIVAGIVVLTLINVGMQMIEPLFMRFVIDKVLLDDGMAAAAQKTRLHVAGAAFLTLVLVNSVIGIAKDYRQRALNMRVVLSLRRALFQRLLRLPLPRLWEMKTGGVLSRLTGDVDTTAGLLQTAIVSPAISVIRLVVAVAILMTLNWRLAIAAVLIIPGAMFVSFTAARRIRPIHRSIRRDAARIDGRVGETFAGIRVVRAFRAEARELMEYMLARHAVLRKELFVQRRELALYSSWALLLAAVNVIIVWYGGWLRLKHRASIGDIMAFQWYTFLLLGPASSIVSSFSDLQRALASTERVFEVFDMPQDKPDRPGAVDAPAVIRELRFEDVTFEYREGHAAVRDLDVTVPAGSVIALVGRSGAGKTTATDLVARFHDPTRGRILANGIDLREIKLQSYRSLLAIVPQDVFLFDGSVRDNIAFGRPDATAAEVEDAARRANAHEFIAPMADGYETFVGERGVKLSGGQRQRLAIARAILAAPQILILDEATSNLDTESEQRIQDAMATLLAGRTTFIIAHRLSTIRRADLILLMDEGRIVERGTHDDLMAEHGLYYEMVRRQFTTAEEQSAVPWQSALQPTLTTITT